MKFLFAMDNFPLYGSQESLEFGKRLQVRGHEVMFCTSARTVNGDYRNGTMINGLPIRYLASKYFPQIPYVVTPGSSFAISSTIRKYKPDISVCMHLVHYTTNSAVLASCWNSVPVFLGIRGPRMGFGSPLPNAGKKLFENTVARISIKIARYILFDCEASRESVNTAEAQEKGVIIYSGVDTRKYVPVEKEKKELIITFVGSLTPTKGVEYLINAIPSVLEKVPHAKFWIVGDGMMKQKLEALAGSLDITRNITFLGYRNDIPAILSETSIFILPSVSEGVSLALLQAGASGKALVASNVGGNAEVITDGQDGFLVPRCSSSDIGSRIVELCNDEDLRQKFGSAIRKKIERRFDWEILTNKLETVAKSVA